MTASRHAWEAEREVDAALAASLVAEQFPHLAGAPVVPFAAGWDNTVHVVAGTWAFRFPRRRVALDCLARETAVLPTLAALLPLPVPVPELHGRPAAAFPWPFAGARLLPGVELARSGIPDSRRVEVAREVGRFLRALHDPSVAAGIGDGLPVDPNRRADPAGRLRRTAPWIERLAATGTWQPGRGVRELSERGRALGAPSGPVVLVHGDLHARHVLVDASARATGVIDWGDVCLADPAVDLSLAYAAFRGAAREALLDAYGTPLDEERELRARVLAVSLCAALADHAATVGDGPLLREALAGLARAVS